MHQLAVLPGALMRCKFSPASLHALQFSHVLLLPPRLEGFRETAAGPCALILPVSG